jgi:hypothetical protein
MAIEDFKSEWYKVNIWGKNIAVVHCTQKIEGEPYSGIDDLTLHGISKNSCPKCNTLYNPKPGHLDTIQCAQCSSLFSFAGALYPTAEGETRKEVERALGWR